MCASSPETGFFKASSTPEKTAIEADPQQPKTLNPNISTPRSYLEDRRPASNIDPYIVTALQADRVRLDNGNEYWHPRTLEVYQKIRDAAGLQLAGIYTHYSSSDEDDAFTAEQRHRFRTALASFEGLDPTSLLIHADNSAGLETIERAGPFNAVRVGLLQFGILPRSGSLLIDVQTEPVFSFRTRVGLVKDLPAGTSISYGQTHRLERASRVAVLTAGYGDGITRGLSNRGDVLIAGRRCPILGRVTMDQTIVNVSHLDAVASGDEVTLIGRQQGAEISVVEFSAWADTIPWETLCSVTKRVPRLYRTSLGI